MPLPYDLDVATLRRFSMNVSKVNWPDAEIESLAERITSKAHKSVGRESEYDVGTDKYQTMKQIIIDGVSGTILNSVETPTHQAAGKEKLIAYYEALKRLRTGRREIISGGPDLQNELDPAQYLPDGGEM
jgi:hypothetical protein